MFDFEFSLAVNFYVLGLYTEKYHTFIPLYINIIKINEISKLIC